MKLRSVELSVPRLEEAARFFESTWRLAPAGGAGARRDFRGSGPQACILSLAEGPPAVSAIVFDAGEEELAAIARRAEQAGCLAGKTETSIEVTGPEGQRYRLQAGAAPVAPIADPERPVRVTHVVLNTLDRENCERFCTGVLGLDVSDRTKHMTFVRSDRKHHCLAFAAADVASLNHIAFEVPSLEAVMRGIGRMQDAGFEVVWGPGRHGPGNNVFGYFVGPHGGVIEYTAEVSEVGDGHRVGGPQDWTWPPGRMDQWGVSKKDTAKTGPAERLYRFR